MAVVLFLVLGGRELMAARGSTPTSRTSRSTTTCTAAATGVPTRGHRRRADRGGTGDHDAPRTRAVEVVTDQVLTLVAFVGVAVVALVFDKNIGFVAITAAVILAMLVAQAAQGRGQADRLADRPAGRRRQHLRDDPDRRAGAPEFVGNWAAGLGAAVLGALVLCYVGGVVSAFASSTALLPVIIPIAIPLIADGGISAAACSSRRSRSSSTIVDVSPFSTNGALMLANRPDTISEEPVYYKQILTYSVHRRRRRPAARAGPPSSCPGW